MISDIQILTQRSLCPDGFEQTTKEDFYKFVADRDVMPYPIGEKVETFHNEIWRVTAWRGRYGWTHENGAFIGVFYQLIGRRDQHGETIRVNRGEFRYFIKTSA